MKEQFVSYEIAKELKELGFNEPCFAGFNTDGSFVEPDNELNSFRQRNLSGGEISAPLWQQVIDWFREKHNLIIWTYLEYTTKQFVSSTFDGWRIMKEYADSYEKSREQAILKVIELIKNK